MFSTVLDQHFSVDQGLGISHDFPLFLHHFPFLIQNLAKTCQKDGKRIF